MTTPEPTGTAPIWRAKVLTLFTAMFPGPLGQSLAGKALEKGLWGLDVIDIRSHATDKHRTVDDTPFGGGPGMVMRPDVVAAAIAEATADLPPDLRADVPKIYFSPRGKKIDQVMVRRLAKAPAVVLICGRYEGLDERVIEAEQLEEVSLGDFVLSGGELPALTLIDSVVRLLPGVMGNAGAHEDDSFEHGLLEHPLYTQPRSWNGHDVPEVLTSGDHGKIAAWRKAQAEAVTKERRPDLWQAYREAMNKDGKKTEN
ncbi:MAG: tRNA (guanosine(37)-N1)-methyltransferase TrmD [Alphaproteobacteria bacterium]|nr:tRNA (guanosine(37)-N1)-methyltransferase TrmD [Alphaproteobacteria bacterium]